MSAKIQLELPKERIAEIEDLMRRTNTATKKDFINNALTLLEWAIEERENGRIITSLDERNKSYKELVMPILSSVKPREPVGASTQTGSY
jgi:hypothetical protein